jgi:hypothetical protein
MHLLIWLTAILFLGFWSASVWLLYAGAQLALTMPWDQAIAAIRAIEVPAVLRPFLEPFGAEAWIGMVEAFGPLMQWVSSLFQGSAGALAGALPVLAWLLWGIGALMLIGLAAAGSVAVWLVRCGKSKINLLGLKPKFA